MATSVAGPGIAVAETADDSLEILAPAEQELVFKDQNEFGVLLTDILDALPEYITDMSWEMNHGVIVVAPGGENLVRDYLSKQNIEVGITLRTANPGVVPFRDRDSVMMGVIEAFSDMDNVALNTHYDPDTGRIGVTIWTQNTIEAATRVAQVMNQPLGVEVDVVYEDASTAPQLTASQGGEDYGTVYCTGGFMATYGSSYGILTAAHCLNKPAMYNGSQTTSVSRVALGTNNVLYDIRFTQLTGSTAVNKIRYNNSGGVQTITATGSPTAGMTLFSYGRHSNSGYKTAVVLSGTNCSTAGNTTYCGLYMTTKPTPTVTYPTDSGGPWFNGSTAYGITHGFDYKTNGSYFTPIGRIEFISGVSVKIK